MKDQLVLPGTSNAIREHLLEHLLYLACHL
jgi:hypothetical protein